MPGPVHWEAQTDREHCRSSAPCDLWRPRCQHETCGAVDLGHSGPSWIDLAEIRVEAQLLPFASIGRSSSPLALICTPPKVRVILIVVTYGIGARRCGLLLAPWHCQLF